MILHKLLFFRLPYRWAAYGDRPLDGFSHASPHEDGGNGSDMDRLEREVSSYPGFKSTPRLDTLFASRRLPRSYLVLLESLLNVSPVARPSCEKVLAALHLGKVRSYVLFLHSSLGLMTCPFCSLTQSSQNLASRMFLPLGRHRCLIPPRLPHWSQHFVFPQPRRLLHRLHYRNLHPHLPYLSIVQHPFSTALQRRSRRSLPCGPGRGDGSSFHNRPRSGQSSLAS